jgi:uncharacterized protein
MGKILFLAFLALVVWLAIKSRPRRSASSRAGQVESMVACAKCGIHFPRSEAIEHRGRLYCSEDHLAASRQ